MTSKTLVLLAALASLCAQDVLTQRNDERRSGANLAEQTLTHASVRAKFGRLWTLYSDSQIMAQPLYLTNLKSAKCPGGCKTVIFGTMNNTVYAYRVDRRPQLAAHPGATDQPTVQNNDVLLWAHWLGTPRPGDKDIDMWSTNDPVWGIVGTPAIDKAANRMYVVAWNDDGGGKFTYRLHALDLFDGLDVAGSPVTIAGSVPGRDQNGHPAPRVFSSQSQKQRPGLLLRNGVVFIAFGAGNETAENFSGFVFAYDAGTLHQRAIWCSAPTGVLDANNPKRQFDAGIWQSGQGLAADSQGNLYFNTGNGGFDIPEQGRLNYGDSLVKLHLEADPAHPGQEHFVVKASFTPCDQAYLNCADLDFGSAAPLLLGTSKIVTGGKQGRLYLLDTSNFGHFTGQTVGPGNNCQASPPPVCANDAAVLQEVQAASGHLHGTPLFWQGPGRGFVYTWGEESFLNAYPFDGNRFQLQQQAHSAFAIPPGMPGGLLAVSSNGAKPGTGIVWALVPNNGDSNKFRGVVGQLVAFNAEDITQPTLFQTGGAGSADVPGLLARFCPPTVADGMVFVSTLGDNEPLRHYGGGQRPTTFPAHFFLTVYGLH